MAQSTTFGSDTLQTVQLEVFKSKIQWKAAPVAIAALSKNELNSYSPISLVPVINQLPGIRMEERSPGSYRLSVRGSLLRSPFGVRNLKLYWNQIPLSDATGNAYLNLVELADLDAVTILKGPSASIYGAGTGGVVLLDSKNDFSAIQHHQLNMGLSVGADGMIHETAGWKFQSKKISSNLQQSHLKYNGYREQSAMEKKHIKYNAAMQLGQHQLDFLSFYTDLFYQTPGGITLAQMQSNPRLSRQATATLPSAITQQASISNKTIFAGLSDKWVVSNWSTMSAFVSINNTQFENPFITNYEFRNETNAAAGIQWQWFSPNRKLEWTSGGEWLFNHSNIANYGNRKGVADTIQYKDDIHAKQWTIYSQLQWHPMEKWLLQMGLSLNQQSVDFIRLTDNPMVKTDKSTNPIIAPRIALSYQLSNSVTAYAIASFGFSPPSLAEIRPSDGKFYGDLQAEYGWNKEIGIKGFFWNNRLQFDLAYYHFQLLQAIVRRNNATGSEYFVNAGSATQQGIEAMVKYALKDEGDSRKWSLHAYSSVAFQPYRFDNYQQGANNYNGNAITGVPRNTWVTGFNLEWIKQFYLNASVNAVDPIPLTDANDAIADAYQLVQLKTGFKKKIRNSEVHIFAGVDNLLNQTYSLGNDINAVGRRFYNPATERNYYLGFNLQFR
ncbi:MAG: TonB-dependent receptor [Sediminibacterium sp.]